MTASAQLRIQQKKIQNAIFQGQKRAARELVQTLIELIKNRVRLIREDIDGNKFDSLDPKYVELRKKFSKRLSKETFPNTSNATATGQMIDSMRGKASGTKITVTLKDDRKKKELNGSSPRIGNNEVAFWYQKKMGIWFGLQESEKEKLISQAAEIIKEEIKKVNK